MIAKPMQTATEPQLELHRLPAAPAEALYVHIPFCGHKCHYCDFYSITRQSHDRMERFVDLLLREADLWMGSAVELQPRTIFFGGGTPSLLPPSAMHRLISGLRSRFDLSVIGEWTVEVNPATADQDYLGMLKSVGVDRISFGAQSFNRSELATLERHHNPDDVPRGIELARGAGFHRINLDLIFAIPGQTLESWSRSLDAAMQLGTTHLSCYALTYEPNTPMAVKKRLGVIRAADEELELEMLRYTRRTLTDAGIRPYEISNCATPGQECRHNLNYWTGGNYLALGPSAASHIAGWRWKNRPHLGEWERSVEADRLPASDVEKLSPIQRAGELAMLMLRLTRGIEFATFTDRTGYDAKALFAGTIERLSQAQFVCQSDNAVYLTENAIGVADAVAGEFLGLAETA